MTPRRAAPLPDGLVELIPRDVLDAVALDSADAERLRVQRTYRLNVFELPLLRLLGFALLALGVLLHNVFILDAFSWPAWGLFAATVEVYALISWATLYLWFSRVTVIDLGFGFLLLDVIFFALAIYVTGGEQSWIFFLLIFRVIDQVSSGVSRTLFFAHYTTLVYLALIAYLAHVEARVIDWPTEYTKMFLLYAGGLYVSFSARGPEGRRRAMSAAMRIARTLIWQLGEKSRELQRSKVTTEAALADQEALTHENAQLYDMAQQQRRRLTRIFESTSDGILFIGRDGRLESANGRAGELLGLDLHVATGQRLLDVMVERVPLTSFAHALGRLLQNPGSEPQGYVEMADARRILHWTARPIDLDPTASAGLTVTISDVTQSHDLIRELKRKSTQLEESMHQAEAASRAKSQFVANMSHEIRTPLTSILGLTQLALEAEPTLEQRERLRTVLASADSLLTILDDILDFSKVEARKLRLERLPFNVRDTLDDVVQTFGLSAHEKGLELCCHVSPDVPDRVVGDRRRVRQVLVNLVANAIKFTDSGDIILRANVESRATETLTLHFTVADTGMGVPADKQHSIFKPFSQANGATTRRHGGTGLGLSISSQLTELMGGDIWLEDRQPGSMFHVTAAFGVDTDATDTVTPIREALASIRGQRILVADAHETTRLILNELLTAWGLEPTATSSDAAALAELRAAFEASTPYRFAIVDAGIPASGGIALCDDLVQTPPLVDAIILMRHISGRVSAVDRRHPQIAAYCTKPLTRTRLLDAITSAAGLPPAPGTLATARPADDVVETGRSLRVLVAEDTATHRTLVESILTGRGHLVAGVSNGREVLAALARRSFDVILMDLQMPDMDGFECTRAIRTAGTHRGDDRGRLAGRSRTLSRGWHGRVREQADRPRGAAGRHRGGFRPGACIRPAATHI